MGLDLRLLEPVDREDGGHVGTSYGGFMRFRERLCESAGWGDIHEYTGFVTNGKAWPTDEPLVALLNHSDCDGELWGWDCEGLANAIRAIVRLWPKHDYDREYGERLASMVERAEKSGGMVAFR
jgi:hypothetical protein